VFSISVETRAGVTRHHLDSAIDALAIVEDMQKETQLPIVVTNRAAGQVLTFEELWAPRKLRALPCPPVLKARSAQLSLPKPMSGHKDCAALRPRL
jgi:hypothetical protein